MTDSAAANARPTILLVDDDDAVRDSLADYLYAKGWQVVTAPSAVEMAEGATATKAEAPGVQEIEKLAKDGAISADSAAAEITDMLVQTSSEANPLSTDEKKLLGEVMLTMVRMDTMGDEDKARASESLVNVMTQPQYEIPLEQVLEKLGAHPFKAAA